MRKELYYIQHTTFIIISCDEQKESLLALQQRHVCYIRLVSR